MTVEDFEAEKQRLIATYGGTARDAGQQRVKALAQLYARSGWTEQALAEMEEASQSQINRLLIFGRFLLTPNWGKEQEVNESQFRKAWQRTNKTTTEEARFAAVAELLAEARATGKVLHTRQLGQRIVADFSDSKWHRVEEIATAVEADPHTVKDLLDRIVTRGMFKTYAEKRLAGKSLGSYRLVKGGKKKIDVTAFLAEAKPVLDEMEQLINGHQVHFSQQAMKMTFAQFRHTIERICR